jgi:hypothetical protein
MRHTVEHKFLIVYQRLFQNGTDAKVKELKAKASIVATDHVPLQDLLTDLTGVSTWSAFELEALAYIMNRDVNASALKPWDDDAQQGEGW